ncbi:unnamed protein product [Amoebophrya sp. A120]|nr:unnamed protein product [Amoebophrya sp. A120]|eukprot:GSA120T00008877001.1
MMRGLLATGAVVVAQGLAYAALLLSMKFIFVHLDFPYPLFISACNSFCGVLILLFSSAVAPICTTKSSRNIRAASNTSAVVEGEELLLSGSTKNATESRRIAQAPTAIPFPGTAQQCDDGGATVLRLASSCSSTTASSEEDHDYDAAEPQRQRQGGCHGAQTFMNTGRRMPEHGEIVPGRANHEDAQICWGTKCHALEGEGAQKASAIGRSAPQLAPALDYGALIYFGGFFGAVNIGFSNLALSLLDPPSYGVLMKNLLLSDVVVFFLLDSLNRRGDANEHQATSSAAAIKAGKAENASLGAEAAQNGRTTLASSTGQPPSGENEDTRWLARRYLFPWHALPSPFRVCLQLGLVLCGAVGSAWLVASPSDANKAGEPSEAAGGQELDQTEQGQWGPLLGTAFCFLALLFSSLKDAVRQYCLHEEKRLPMLLEQLLGLGTAAASSSGRFVDTDGPPVVGRVARHGNPDHLRMGDKEVAKGKVAICVVQYSARACAVQFLCLLVGALGIEGRAPFRIFEAELMEACGVVVTSSSQEGLQHRSRSFLLVGCIVLCCLLGFAVTTATAELSKLTDVVSQSCYRYASFLLLTVLSFVVFGQVLTAPQMALCGLMFFGIIWFAVDFHFCGKRDGAQKSTLPAVSQTPGAGAVRDALTGAPDLPPRAAMITAAGSGAIAKNRPPISSGPSGGTDTSGSTWPAQCRVALTAFVSVVAIAFLSHNASGARLRTGAAARGVAAVLPGLSLKRTTRTAQAAPRAPARVVQFLPGQKKRTKARPAKFVKAPPPPRPPRAPGKSSGPNAEPPPGPRAPVPLAAVPGMEAPPGRMAPAAAHFGQENSGEKGGGRAAEEFASDATAAGAETFFQSGPLLTEQAASKSAAPADVVEGSGTESAAAVAANDKYPLAAHGTDLKRLSIFLNPERVVRSGSAAAIGGERADFQARGPAEDVARGEACTCGRWGEFTKMQGRGELGFCGSIDEKTAAGRLQIERRLETARGYTPTCCMRQTTQVLWDLADNVFDKYGLEYKLSGGTALAAIRCGSMTSYDYDLDLVVYAPGSVEVARDQLRAWAQGFRSSNGTNTAHGGPGAFLEARAATDGAPVEDAAARAVEAHLRARGVCPPLIAEALGALASPGPKEPGPQLAGGNGAATRGAVGPQALLQKADSFSEVQERVEDGGRGADGASFLRSDAAKFRRAASEFLVLQRLGPMNFQPRPGPRNFEITGTFENKQPGAVQNGSVHVDIGVVDEHPPALRPVFFGGRIVKAAASAREDLQEHYGVSYFTPLRWEKWGHKIESEASRDTCEDKSCEAARAEMRAKLCPVVPDLMFGEAAHDEC